MLKLSAFADEISPDLNEQIRVCRENQVTHFELRGVYGKNVMDFDDALRREIKTKLAGNGLGVISIGSPIGKVAIDQPWSEHFERFKRAVEIAEYFGAPLLRVFSYYPPGGERVGGWGVESGELGASGKPGVESGEWGVISDAPPPTLHSPPDPDAPRPILQSPPGSDSPPVPIPTRPHRDEVIDRFHKKVEYLKNHPVTLVHENEKGIFGDIGRRCLDLMKSVDSPKLRSAFDFANFVQVGERPIDNWPLLKPYTVHIHIKDAKAATGQIVPAGGGDGNIGAILLDARRGGYDGFLSLEPHLKVAGHSHGETGPELFKVGVDALKKLCRRNGIPLALPVPAAGMPGED